VPAVTLGVSTNFILANCLASRSLGNVSVALMSARLLRGRSNETYQVAWDFIAIETPRAGRGACAAMRVSPCSPAASKGREKPNCEGEQHESP
jgi:hypothetical protein